MKEQTLSIVVEEQPGPEDIRPLVQAMRSFNQAHHRGAPLQSLAVFLEGPRGGRVGGALGSTHWGWLHISHLWVPERFRRHGWGRRLVEALEVAAVARGCHGAHVDTFSFQARDFYERLGYELFGTLPDYPVGEALHFLRKRLAPLPKGARPYRPERQ